MQWSTANCYQETYSDTGTFGCEHSGEVLLKSKLFPALQSLNPVIEALNLAFEELAHDRSAMGMVAAKQDVYQLLCEGFTAQVQTGEGWEVEDMGSYGGPWEPEIDWDDF